MARQKRSGDATNAGTDLQKAELDLKARGLEYEIFEYPHAYMDLLYKDENGDKVKREFRPDGTELLRDWEGKEVK